MSDPYKVLGVSPYATDDEISKAYKNLAKKYHPDNYTDIPLADLATEKMQEINQAYDEIKKTRRESSSYNYNKAGYQSGAYTGYSGSYQNGDYAGYQSSYSSSSSKGNAKYKDVRMMIRQGRIADADQILSGVPSDMRDAEWYFLKGTILYRNGWTEQAYENFSRACNMEPDNDEFRAALIKIEMERQGRYSGYNTNQYDNGRYGGCCSGCNSCTACTTLCCADTCCECMGGDLIACC